MNRFIADENFPHPSFRLLTGNGVDVVHVGIDSPTIDDPSVLRLAVEQSRILLTLDRDHGELVFRHLVAPPPGVVYFRLIKFRPDELGSELLRLIRLDFKFEGFFTVVGRKIVRQRTL